MGQKLVQEEIESLYRLSHSIVGSELFQCPEDPSAQRLQGYELLEHLAWRIVVPILVAVTGSVTSEALKKRVFSNKGTQNPETQARALEGREKSALSDGEISLCVRRVQEIISDYGGTEEQARKIVEALLDEAGKTTYDSDLKKEPPPTK